MDLRPTLVREETQGCGVFRLRDDGVARPWLGVDTERGGERPDQVAPANHLTECYLYPTKVVRAVGRDALGEQTGHKIELDAESRARLQVVAAEEARGTVKGVRFFDIAVDEDVLPRNEGIIEQQHRVVLVEAARQGVVEGADRLILVGASAEELGAL